MLAISKGRLFAENANETQDLEFLSGRGKEDLGKMLLSAFNISTGITKKHNTILIEKTPSFPLF